MSARMLFLVATVAVALCVPATAVGAPIVVGSPLDKPNVNLGCDLKPQLTFDTSGNFFFPPSGVGDCTWSQQAVFGAQGLTDPRGRTVPATGRITSVSVKSGPNPSPLRFVIFRQLAQTGGASDYCCYFVRETPEVTPTPNAVSTFAVNLPVERGALVKSEILSYDLFGVSGRAGAGSLPLADVGPHTSAAYLTPGAVDAGFFYPRIGALPNDEPAGRSEGAVANFELLLNWTFCATGDPTCDPAAQPPPQLPPVQPPPQLPPPPPQIPNTFTLPAALACTAISCPLSLVFPGPGTLTATDAKATGRVAVAAAKKKPKKPKYQPLIAKTTTTVKAAGKLKLTLKLSSAGAAAFKKKGTLKVPVKLVYTPTGGKAGTKTVTITFKKPKKKKSG